MLFIQTKNSFSNKLNLTDDSFHIKSTLTLRIFSQQQSFHALLSQSTVIMIFETSEWHYVNLGETLKKKKKKMKWKETVPNTI